MTLRLPPLLRDPQVLALLGVLAVCAVLVVGFADAIAPFLAAAVIAYVLERMIRALERLGLPRWAAFAALYLAFFLLLLWGFFWLLPAVVGQLKALVADLPRIVAAAQHTLEQRLEETRRLVGAGYVEEVTRRLSEQLREAAQGAVTAAIQGIPGLVTLLVYLVLVTFLVFFFLKDKERILDWICRFWPRDRALLNRVLRDVDAQMGRYVTGKLWEVAIVTVATEVAFGLLGLHYAFLLALLTGVSVLVPYIGAAAVALPVAVLAFAQWGFTWDAGWVLLAYGAIQLVDGNLLAPLIVGEAVHLHPTAIILAVLVFGSAWGVWGAFFAVPLAVVVKSVLDALPLGREPNTTKTAPSCANVVDNGVQES
ncbi:MAG: AI-2E family transporter [Nitrospirae bacterium]|nr:MAG: AI-2E family transporter [Nitrospirota bacterium]